MLFICRLSQVYDSFEVVLLDIIRLYLTSNIFIYENQLKVHNLIDN